MLYIISTEPFKDLVILLCSSEECSIGKGNGFRVYGLRMKPTVYGSIENFNLSANILYKQENCSSLLPLITQKHTEWSSDPNVLASLNCCFTRDAARALTLMRWSRAVVI